MMLEIQQTTWNMTRAHLIFSACRETSARATGQLSRRLQLWLAWLAKPARHAAPQPRLMAGAPANTPALGFSGLGFGACTECRGQERRSLRSRWASAWLLAVAFCLIHAGGTPIAWAQGNTAPSDESQDEAKDESQEAVRATSAFSSRIHAPLLQGPHPFNHRNALSVGFGARAAAGDAIGGVRLQVGYGYALNPPRNLWLDLRVGLVQGAGHPEVEGDPCASCGTGFDVMAGLAYRVPLDIPLVPYAQMAAGFVYVFPAPGEATLGLALMPALGARYYLHDWLGFGAELAGLLGFVNHGEQSGLSNDVVALQLTLGAEYQF